MAYKIKVRFQDTNEEIELVEEEYDNNGALLYYYHDGEYNYFHSHLTPFNKWPAHSIHPGMSGIINNRFATVIEKEDV